MSHVATAPHECKGHLRFAENGLAPYWTVGSLLTNQYDGYGEIETEILGETWEISFAYQKSGIAPRLVDDVGGERLYEFKINARGRGQRKIDYNLSPRFPDMQHYESGDAITTPFGHLDEDEGIACHFQGSNLEPDAIAELLPKLVRALGDEVSEHISKRYFRNPHPSSTIYEYERYVRITRNMNKKLIGRGGVMQKIMLLLADQKGLQATYDIDNEDVVGKMHKCKLGPDESRELWRGHSRGRQIKSYLKKDPNSGAADDPTRQPKVGVLLRKSLNKNNPFRWGERRELDREIEESIINLLAWSDIPTKTDPTTFVEDDHFSVEESDRSIEVYDDPTPQIEANQEAMLVTCLRDMTDADVDIVDSLLSDGGGQHPEELAENAGVGLSTVYRALQRLKGVIENEGATISFASRKFADEVQGIIESTEHQIKNAADRAAKILNMDTRHAASSAFEKWLAKYAAEVELPEDGAPTIRIDTILSELKATPQPLLEDVLNAMLNAWSAVGRDPVQLRRATVQWRDRENNWQVGRVGALVR